MLTDVEREQLYSVARQRAAMPSQPASVSIANLPQIPEPIDPAPALAEIAAAVKALKGVEIVKAIHGLAGVPESIARLEQTLGAIGKAVANIKHANMDGIAQAIADNTAAVRAMTRVMILPKIVVFDDDDDEKPIGIETVSDN